MKKVAQVKRLFFNAPAVTSAVDQATREVLSRFGAFVRTAARSSIRQATKKRQVSRPGQPPVSHTGLLRRLLFFSWDSSQRSVVIGPAIANARGAGVAPAALEYGGQSRRDVRIGGQWRRKRVLIRPRPYMAPALTQELPKLPPMWANSVKP